MSFPPVDIPDPAGSTAAELVPQDDHSQLHREGEGGRRLLRQGGEGAAALGDRLRCVRGVGGMEFTDPHVAEQLLAEMEEKEQQLALAAEFGTTLLARTEELQLGERRADAPALTVCVSVSLSSISVPLGLSVRLCHTERDR